MSVEHCLIIGHEQSSAISDSVERLLGGTAFSVVQDEKERIGLLRELSDSFRDFYDRQSDRYQGIIRNAINANGRRAILPPPKRTSTVSDALNFQGTQTNLFERSAGFTIMERCITEEVLLNDDVEPTFVSVQQSRVMGLLAIEGVRYSFGGGIVDLSLKRNEEIAGVRIFPSDCMAVFESRLNEDQKAQNMQTITDLFVILAENFSQKKVV